MIFNFQSPPASSEVNNSNSNRQDSLEVTNSSGSAGNQQENSRKHSSIKSKSEVSYSQRKNHRIDLQKQAHRNKKNELLEQLKRRKVSSDNDPSQNDDYVNTIKNHIGVLNSQDSSVSQKVNAMKQCRIILSKCDPDTLTDILEEDDQFVYLLHQFLTCKYSELQLESAWCITNIAAMKDDSVSFCIPTLVQLISNSFIDVVLQEQCIWALGNISLGSSNNGPLSTVIIQNGAILYLCNVIRACRVNEILKTTLWCVSNIIRNELLHMKQNSFEHNQQIFTCLTQLYEPIIYLLLKRQLTNTNISELLYVLSYLTAYPLLDTNIISSFAQICIKYLTLQQNEFITPIIRIIGNIFSFCNIFSTLDKNLSLELMNLLSNIPDKNKEWCYMMGNISSYEELNDILVQQYHLLDTVVKILLSILDYDPTNHTELIRETTLTIINLVTANSNKYMSKDAIELIQKVAQVYSFDDTENNQQFKTILLQFFDFLEELCSNLALYHEQYKPLSDKSNFKIKRWEEAKFLQEQGFEASDRTHPLDELEQEELRFECENDVLPSYAIPSSSSRRDLEIILNQILSIVKSDHQFKEWIVLQSISFQKENNDSLMIEGFLKVIQKLFGLTVKKPLDTQDDVTVLDSRVEESIWKTIMFEMKENHKGEGLIIDIAFAFLFIRTKEYDKAEVCILNFLPSIEKYEPLLLNYFNLILAHLLRINFKLDSSACYLRKVVNNQPFVKANNLSLYSAIYMWMGEVMESMDLYMWAVECYLKCCRYFSDYSNINHPFVTISFVFLKLAELFFKDFKESGKNMNLCKLFYHKSLNGFDRANLKHNKTFIELSPYTINYNKSSIAIRLGCIYYLEKNFEKSLDYFLKAEKLLLKIRFEQSQKKNEGSALAVLQTLHRKIAINFCRLGRFDEAARYVTYRIIVESVNVSDSDYQQQLNMILEEKERERKERQSHAKYVIAQEHPSCFLSLSIVSFHKRAVPELCKYCEMLFKTNESEKEMYLPLLTVQKVVSLLISSQQFELAQLALSKYMISLKNYALGYYILFLLSIKNRDDNSIVGCWRKFNETYSPTHKKPFEPMQVYWPFILSSSTSLRLPLPKL